MHKKRDYNVDKPSDVRQFKQEIARLMSSGPVGASQAARMIDEATRTPEGKRLVKEARLSAKIEAESQKVNFNNVKIHTGGNSHQLNKSLSTQAFTTGNDVFFREGEFNPGSSADAELIAHELTHVAQQSQKK